MSEPASPELWSVARGQPGYPASLVRLLGAQAPEALTFCGVRALWCGPHGPWLGLVASVRCPGEVILATYDLAVALRQAGVPVMGGFHSPMEREALRLLLRGQQPVALCPARALEGMRLAREHRRPLAEGRLLLMSPCPDGARRVTKEGALLRNRVVAALADALLVVHAQPGGKAEALAREALAWGKRVYTLDLVSNHHLLASGAGVFDLESWARRV